MLNKFPIELGHKAYHMKLIEIVTRRRYCIMDACLAVAGIVGIQEENGKNMLNHYWLYIRDETNTILFTLQIYMNPLFCIVDRDKHILNERKCGHFHKRFSVSYFIYTIHAVLLSIG